MVYKEVSSTIFFFSLWYDLTWDQNPVYFKQFNLAWVHSLIVKNISISSYSVYSNSSNSANSV